MNTKGSVLDLCKKYIDAMLVCALMWLVFYYIFIKCGYSVELGDCYGSYDSDIPYHVASALDACKKGDFFHGNFLLYFLVNVLSGFTSNFKLKGAAMCFLLAGAESVAYVLFRNRLNKTMLPSLHRGLYARALALCMIVVFIIPYAYYMKALGLISAGGPEGMYSGYYVPTVWHNSTVIFSMPFSLGLFFLSEKALADCRKDVIVAMCVLVALDVLVKPSFFFIFVTSFPLMAAWKWRFSRPFFLCLLPCVVGLLCMVYVYVTIFTTGTDGASVVVDFSRLLRLDGLQLLRMITSLMLPFLFLLLEWKVVKTDRMAAYVALLVASAIGISLVCVETGPRQGHGNMSWQVIPAMQIAYFYILEKLVSVRKTTMRDKTINVILLVLFSLHVISGLWYLIRYILFGVYG